ncbi:hypothetical protein [Promicromonospora sukumoe]|uniref:hypothetical protein n=1 Tax=Promicromonospora sukumoe TaxID=88382 RepID=UPI00365609C7
MGLTRHLRSHLAGTRPGSAGALTVMFLVLTVASVHALCSVHLDGHGGAQAHDAGVHAAAATAQEAVVETAPEPLGGGSHGCSDQHDLTARCDPVLVSPGFLTTLPDRGAHRQPPAVVDQEHRAASSVADAEPPSLHALGISRT